ncbi:hypothetical protein [Hyphomicrobium sulfonivorans]|nr:hypothetical protein [Hyphomicrobium sulfonivorans]
MHTTLRIDDLRSRLIEFAHRSVNIMQACINEESTKLFLVMPMLGILGYDYTNPFEVHPEHEADFSGCNKVDLAILRDSSPIVAIECKKVGTDLAEQRGQLRGYFNALITTKLGVLTDGLVYEFFVDSADPNIMDDEPFLTLDLETVSRVGISDEMLDSLKCMTKENYNPDQVAEAAYVRLVKKRLRTLLAREFADPSEDFCRFALRGADVKGVRRDVIEKHYAPMIRTAIHEVTRVTNPAPAAYPSESLALGNEKEIVDSRIVTTERELAVFSHVRRRLAYLVKDEIQFDAIEQVRYKDYIGKMRIFYLREYKGRLFDYIEGSDGFDKYIFPEPVGAVVTNNILDIDAALRAVFISRVKALADDARQSPTMQLIA